MDAEESATKPKTGGSSSRNRSKSKRVTKKQQQAVPSVDTLKELLAVEDEYGHYAMTSEQLEARILVLRKKYQFHHAEYRRLSPKKPKQVRHTEPTSEGGFSDSKTEAEAEAEADLNTNLTGATGCAEGEENEGEGTSVESQSTERRAGRSLRASKRSEAERDSVDDGSKSGEDDEIIEETDGQVRSVVHIFKCPWPDCDRTFEKIKSRSAHLKWHGGDYEETDGADGEHGEGSAAGDFDSQDSEGPGPSKRRRTTSRSDDSAETVESEEQTNSQDGLSGLDAGSTPPLLSPGAKIEMPVGGQHPSLAGKIATIDSVAKSDDGNGAIYRVFVYIARKRRFIHVNAAGITARAPKGNIASVAPAALSSPEEVPARTGWTDVSGSEDLSDRTSNKMPGDEMVPFGMSIEELAESTAAGSKLLYQTEIDGKVAFKMGVVEKKRGGKPLSAMFLYHPDGDSTHWVAAQDLSNCVTPQISQLKHGFKVLAVPPSREGNVLYPGTVQRIETSRIRVNFEAWPVAWRKQEDIRWRPCPAN